MLGKGGVDLGPFVLLPPVGLGPPVDPGQGSLISVLLLALLLDHLAMNLLVFKLFALRSLDGEQDGPC